MKNIHITLTNFTNESRILKEISSLNASNFFDDFLVIALGDNKLPCQENIKENFSVRRINLKTRPLPKNLLFQHIKFLEFFVKVFIILLKTKPNVINIHTLALLPLGYIAKLFLKSKLVYDAHELETEKNGLSGLKKLGSKFIEKLFIKQCDLIVVVSDSIADWYANEYKIKRPLVIHNSPNIRKFHRNNLFRESLNISEKQKILLYQGALSRGRGIEVLLKAFSERESNDIVLVLMGYGSLEVEIKKISSVNENIFFYPAVDPYIVLEYTSSADFGISFIENICLSYYYCMPNKLFEYAMAGLPVIASNMKEMSENILKYKFGTVIDDCSTKNINKAIESLNSQDLTQLSLNAYNFAQLNSWEKQEYFMLQEYQRILNQ
ncbi:glycosyltransferase [Xenorhabdus nematophila]|uniref:glycosyltransferase n=2 Tax=Xenorhabdus nematophila TaxID=628 RepID=UPI0003275CB2|nr:glycosyltransferase [Xenorhabdus nematophila]CEF33697.1 Glycosyl transferase group 1 family protein [Xenorhabdus nematophila str. Websteri]AYA41580.1 glycosyltransferase [Xenorhabdus nematophila]MBA0020319.1 glycosyltransferase [Xenorhabdus nematophila]MCB4426078.1 glycosyltransferase [Xenorhabdus nematophila]QNJ35971.1 glycosyltransferase [Xenorhabdus nematophila]